jgi:hypothetical protein
MNGYMVHRTRREPKWGWLYAVIGVLVALFGLVETVVPAGAPRRILEILVVLALIAAMALWVRVNRTALDGARERRVWPVQVLVPVVVVPAGRPQHLSRGRRPGHGPPSG